MTPPRHSGQQAWWDDWLWVICASAFLVALGIDLVLNDSGLNGRVIRVLVICLLAASLGAAESRFRRKRRQK